MLYQWENVLNGKRQLWWYAGLKNKTTTKRGGGGGGREEEGADVNSLHLILIDCKSLVMYFIWQLLK